jgi:tol-pal system protein YbgF
MFRRVSVFALLVVTAITLAPERSSAASKEIMELQRDVALLQESIKQLQQSQDKQLISLTELVRQSVDVSRQASTSVAVIQSNLQDSLRKMQGDVATPVAGLTTRMNSLSDDMRTVSQSVSDLASQISKIQSQLTDLNNAVKVISAPPVAPPQQQQPAPGGAMLPAGGGAPSAPPMSSQDLYQQALGDRNGGKLDLAIQEFSDYLKYYGNTDLAPNAQFYIANIHYSQGAYDQAASEFDMVLEKYPENNKTREAMMYKGLSLVRAGHKTQGADQFREIIDRYPRTDQATQACSQLTSLGYHCPTTPAKGVAKKKKGL